MCKVPKTVTALIEEGLDNAALAMEEGQLPVHALSVLSATERVCSDAFADGEVTRHEARCIRGNLGLLRLSIEKQLAKDRADLLLARAMNQNIQVLTKQRPPARAALTETRR